MSIDLDSETLIHFATAARQFPGKGVCIQTMHRWRLNGVRGTKLETVLIGGMRYTSKEAIQRFVEAQNARDTVVPAPTPSQRAKQSAAARRELQVLGV